MNKTRFQFTRTSGNSKTGPISTSMTTSDSCPDTCSLKGAGCYARFGMTGMHWRKLDTKAAAGESLDLEAFVGSILALPKGAAFRHNVAGDLPDSQTLDAIAAAAQARKLQGWTYTHRHDESMHQAIAQANAAPGFAVNLSAESPAHADQLKALSVGPVVTVVTPDAWAGGKNPDGTNRTANTSKTPAGNALVRCPAEYINGMNCAACMLCAKADRRGIVGFTAHGSGKNKAAASVLEDTKRRVISINPA